MASPPFSINIALPGDTDIVSQHPVNARAMRDIVESWISVNHDNLGHHTQVDMPFAVAPSAPATNIITYYTDTSGYLKAKNNASLDQFVSLPPGTVVYSAAISIPSGFLLADGSIVSRTTFATLFGFIGTTFGAGDGSTTFGIPDLNGRVIASQDTGFQRLNPTTFGASPTFGNVGGLGGVTLTVGQLPGHSHGINFTSGNDAPDHAHTTNGILVGGGGTAGITTAGVASTVSAANLTSGGASVRHQHPIVGNTDNGNGTGGSAVSVVQPTLILRAIIKY